jgi:hypothetical protein
VVVAVEAWVLVVQPEMQEAVVAVRLPGAVFPLTHYQPH